MNTTEPTTNESSPHCEYAGPGRGDCEHYIGLPSPIHKPGEHDGPDDTVDVYGKPNGWCWHCWWSHRTHRAESEMRRLKTERDAALAQVAEMRDSIEFMFAESKDHHPQYGYLQFYSFSPKSTVAEKLEHALSSDCGKGWVPPEKVQPLVEALRYVSYQRLPLGNTVIETLPEHWQAKVEQALAEWKKTTDSQTTFANAVDKPPSAV